MKIIRDLIPFDLPGRRYGTVSENIAQELLLDKLDEEVTEIKQAVTLDFRDEFLAEELGDLIEVVYAIGARNGISHDAIHEIRKEKARARGVFDKGHVIL